MSVSFEKIIPNTLPCKSIVGVEFFKPLRRFLELARSRRNCPALPDELWLEVIRVRLVCKYLVFSDLDQK
jgi:hypothetical protein